MSKDVCWIKTIDYDEADAGLKAIYDQALGPGERLDALYKPYGLRPHMPAPAIGLYRATLHHDGNSLPKWLLELIRTYVAILTGCDYAAAHHGQNSRCCSAIPRARTTFSMRCAATGPKSFWTRSKSPSRVTWRSSPARRKRSRRRTCPPCGAAA